MNRTSIYTAASNLAPVMRARTLAVALRAFAQSDAHSLAERSTP